MIVDFDLRLLLNNQLWVDTLEITLGIVEAFANEILLTCLQAILTIDFAFFVIVPIYIIAKKAKSEICNYGHAGKPDDES